MTRVTCSPHRTAIRPALQGLALAGWLILGSAAPALAQTGQINGVVTEGWGKGQLVKGEYTEIQCEHDGITTDCWRGTLDLPSER